MTDTILPHAMPAALDAFPEVRVLSLDCFDTLLWRDTHAPRDIFGKLPGTTPLQRGWAETLARRVAGVSKGLNEVSIGEIYAQLLPNASPAERNAAIEAEIAAEAQHCFAFAPTVALMREARARGLQVIIVSDTYLDTNQLRDLIARSAGEDVAGLIDRLFCSSTHGKSKVGGLYKDVLQKLKAKPHEILHIGDNKGADVHGVQPYGVNTLHLEQFTDTTEQRLRLEATVSAMIHPQDTGEVTAHQPHRATLAAAEPQIGDPAASFGLTVLGPVLFGFERWLQSEAEALQQKNGGTVHWLFLMRDGYLPKLVHEGAGHNSPARAVEISRFTATAASFAQEKDIQRHVEAELGLNPETLARQLLIPEAEIGRIVGDLSMQDASLTLLKEVRTGQRKRTILRASRAMAERLAAHVTSVVKPDKGDTLMLIDLGYNGTVQNRIDAVLQKALNVHVAGRFLLLRETDRPGLDKRGFIGIEDYDAHTLEALCANVAVLEQLCTTAMGSVVDYGEEGSPIRRGSDIKQQQSTVRDRVQAGCLQFVRQNRGIAIRRETADELSLWRKGAAATLGRLMYLPLDHELSVIESFEHDVNLGTNRTVALFDPEIAARGMRQRGLFYMKGSERMYLPAELKGHGIAPKLSLLAQKRFGLPLNFSDFSDRTIQLPVIFADRNEVALQQVDATATHDGYFLAAIPIGDCRFSVAVQFGALFDWVEVDSVNALPLADFLSEAHSASESQIALDPVLEGMERAAPSLFHCVDETGFMMIHPPERRDERPMMLALVFRPIAERREQSEQPDALSIPGHSVPQQSGLQA